MISKTGFNSIISKKSLNRSSFCQKTSFGSSNSDSSDLKTFLESKTYDFICADKNKLYCASEWVMSDGDISELAKKKVTVVDFDYDKIAGTKKWAKNLGLNYHGLDEICTNPNDIKSCYQGLMGFIEKTKAPVLLYSMRTKDLSFYLSGLYLIKQKGISIKDAANIIEHKLLIQPRFDLIGTLEKMLKQL